MMMSVFPVCHPLHLVGVIELVIECFLDGGALVRSGYLTDPELGQEFTRD